MSVAEIKQAIDKLSLEERAELNRMLFGWDDDEWDRQMKSDAHAGKFDDSIRRASPSSSLDELDAQYRKDPKSFPILNEDSVQERE